MYIIIIIIIIIIIVTLGGLSNTLQKCWVSE